MPNDLDSKPYLEYLEKEMTIMGILSAVALAAAGGTLTLVFGQKAELGERLWTHGHWAIIAGSTMCVAAGTLFYKQRSLLAWFYGQICLAPLLDRKEQVSGLLEDVDSWATWFWYCWGFNALTVGFVEYIAALVSIVYLPNNQVLLWIYRIVPFVWLFILSGFQWYVMTRFRENENPWSDWWHNSIRKPAPHKGVYARIQSSSVHGVGVFAIQPIPEGDLHI